jgi:type IV pilus assembly protein PilV
MLNPVVVQLGRQQGTTLIEVLVTILVLAFGLLGLAGMQSRAQQAEYESYQRAQAVLLLSGMTDRINANRSRAANYVFTGTRGADDTPPAACADPNASRSDRDLCEWSDSLKGASEKLSSANVGAMIGARGCIVQVQAPDPVVCQPAVYLVSVAWQGLSSTKASANGCGQGAYGSDDSQRRAISSQVTIGLNACSP